MKLNNLISLSWMIYKVKLINKCMSLDTIYVYYTWDMGTVLFDKHTQPVPKKK